MIDRLTVCHLLTPGKQEAAPHRTASLLHVETQLNELVFVRLSLLSFNQLDLPAYESYEKLRHMLLLAIQECSEGFGLA